MVYREVHVIEIKEILLRIVVKDSIRKVASSLGLHRETIRNYISLTKRYGFDSYKDSKDSLTDKLIQKIKYLLSQKSIPW